MINLLIVSQLAADFRATLEAKFTLHDFAGIDNLKPDVAAQIRGVVGTGQAQAPRSLIDALPKLEIISCYGVGYDGVDIDACRERGIIVTNTPDVLTNDVADIALALILNLSRKLIVSNRLVVDGKWPNGMPPMANRVANQRVGIIGLGRIGKAIAQRAEACEMSVGYYGRHQQQGVSYHYYNSLLEMAAAVDFLVVACPGGTATQHMINAEVLKVLGKKGTLINIARGSIVDEQVLVDALSKGEIKGAGLDVFADEPNVPVALLTMENVVLLPHVGSRTAETRQAMAELTFNNIDAHFSGKPVLTPVD